MQPSQDLIHRVRRTGSFYMDIQHCHLPCSGLGHGSSSLSKQLRSSSSRAICLRSSKLFRKAAFDASVICILEDQEEKFFERASGSFNLRSYHDRWRSIPLVRAHTHHQAGVLSCPPLPAEKGALPVLQTSELLLKPQTVSRWKKA